MSANNSGRPALGRGLAALIPGASGSAPSGMGSGGVRSVAIEKIEVNSTQPRKQFDEDQLEDLAASIREHGVLQPVVLRQQGDHYEIVAGERRWRAAGKAGLYEIPAIIKDLTDEDALAVALVENIQRQDLDPLEEAEAFHRLATDHGFSHEEISKSVGKSRSAITNSLRLLQLPPSLLGHLTTGKLTAGHARALMSIKDDAAINQVANEIISRKLSVRDAEQRARLHQQRSLKSKSATRRSPAELALEERLQRGLGTKVRLHHRGGQGRLEISFQSLEHLDDLTERLLS